MFIQEHNSETGEITLRELTAKEISEREKEHNEESRSRSKGSSQSSLVSTTRHYRRTSKTFTFLIKEHCGWS
jgi:hypothetical protein